MFCPFCGHDQTRVVDSRLATEGRQIRRRRECLSCEVRFSTLETAEFALPRVVKRDGTRMPFDEAKLRSGILKALEKRPVATDAIDSLITDLVQRLRLSGEREISSDQIGAWVMTALSGLDQVAYVRFASVYHSFQDVEAFRRQIEQLEYERLKADDHQLPLIKETRRKKK
ncbi:MAG: transcriptional regulator NrdR [Gammaproteobacteria bacterium]